jgi:hypothetical protein
MLGIVKLGTFNHFSGCGYGAFIEPSGSSVLPLQQLGPQCSAQIPELHPTKANDKFRPTNGPFEKFLFEIKSLSCVKAFVRVVERSIVRARSSLEVPDFQKQFGTTSAELKLDEA